MTWPDLSRERFDPASGSKAAPGRCFANSPLRSRPEIPLRRGLDPDPSAAANERAVAQTLHREPREFGRADSQTHTGEWSHLLIVADMKSGSIAKLEEEIATFGQSLAILPQAWLLASEASVNTVRNQLVKQLGKLDVLFVADASNDKAAWFNFGPESDARFPTACATLRGSVTSTCR